MVVSLLKNVVDYILPELKLNIVAYKIIYQYDSLKTIQTDDTVNFE